MKNRESINNVRLLLHVIESGASLIQPAGLLALDTEKAFDKVHWQYLFHTLAAFNMGSSFIRMISALYSGPSAQLFINGQRSDKFLLYRGTRQGCPLSPLLFLLAIEPLLLVIRNSKEIEGLTINNAPIKTSAYGDDVLLYIGNSALSIPALLNLINAYSQFSGYSLNTKKLIFFPYMFIVYQLWPLRKSKPCVYYFHII